MNWDRDTEASCWVFAEGLYVYAGSLHCCVKHKLGTHRMELLWRQHADTVITA